MNYQLVKNNDWKEIEINGKKEKMPNSWLLGYLKNLAIITGGISAPKEFLPNSNNSVPFFRVSNLSSRKKYLTVKETEEFLPKSKYKITPKGSILIAKSGESIKQKYRSILEQDSVIVGHIASLQPLMDKDYLYYQLIYTSPEEYLIQGAAMPSLSTVELGNYIIFYPDENQQKLIASILSKQESIISNIEKLIEKNEIIFNELSEQLLSGELRLKDVDGKVSIYKNAADNWKEVEVNGKMKKIPRDWDLKKVEDCVLMEKNIKKSQINTSEIKNIGKFPVISQEVKFISGFTDNMSPLIASKDNPTIIFGDHSCTLKLVDFNYILGGDGTKVFKSKYNTAFLYHSIKNLKLSTEGYKRHYPLLKEMFINLPTKNEQELLVKFFNNNIDKIKNFKTLLFKEKEKFEWLLDNLLSGNYLVKEIEN